MRENNNSRFLLKASICFILLLIVFFVVNMRNTVFASNENDFCYLSDIPYVEKQSYTRWGKICQNKTSSDTLISVMIENSTYSFEKGIWAHATSNVVYDLSDYKQYNYFTAFIGLNTTAASSSNGVKFYIYTSTDGEHWDLKTDAEPAVSKPGQNATFVKIDIRDAKFLRLYADDNGSQGNDHAVYADAKLIKEDYDDNVVPSVEEYDKIIKTQYADAELSNKEYELKLLQREFVDSVGRYALKRFVQETDPNKEVLSWLMDDVENLRLYIVGGEPDGNYYNSLKVLAELYHAYKDDFDIDETTKYGTRLGDLYKKMAITLSLTHSTTVGLWMNPNVPENQSNAVDRYRIFKQMHADGKFVVSDNQDHTKWFEALQIEEMRFVLNNIIDDEEILWLNEYTQKYIDEHPGQEEIYLQPHRYMKYIWPNYDKPEYYDEDNKQMWSEKYGNFLDYGVTYKLGVPKLWMNIDNGAVCGGISKIGSNIRGVHGTPSSVISQPGHAALIYYRKNEQGQGYWTIDNDVSGWSKSGRTERLNLRMPLGWGDEEYIDHNKDWLGLATYVLLAQGALNDFDNYQTSRETLILADVYKDDLEKLYEVYREAIEAEPLNIDAWYGLIKAYKADDTKGEEDFYNLSVEIFDKLKYYPLPMYHLAREIKPELTSVKYSFKFVIDQDNALNEAKVADATKTIQVQAVQQEANYLLEIADTDLATFSFDGEDAKKIVLSSMYDESGLSWDYSIDGKQKWNLVTYSPEEEHKLLLSDEQINSITAENDIYVHVQGLDYSDNNIFKIDIKEQDAPKILYNNDLENKVIGATPNMEWRMQDSEVWTSFKDAEPDLTGDKTVVVRNTRTGVYLQSAERTLTYTTDTVDEARKYIPISRLSIEDVSSEEKSNADNKAINAIDGNINTVWHTNWSGDLNRYIVIELDRPVYLSALEYVPGNGGNGRVTSAQILVSMDGENWTEVVSGTTWPNNTNKKEVTLNESAKARYVKFVAKEQASQNGNSNMMAAMINLYEDTTKHQIPTAKIKYNITESTNKNVIATLVQPSTEITITNNEGKNYHVFEENGTFEFKFVDESGVEGIEVAKVDWINKELDNPEEPDKEAEITSDLYKIEEGYISGIKPGTTVNIFEQNSEAEEAVTFIKDGKILSQDSVISTGTIIKVGPNIEYTLVVTGDIDGDGQITVTDLAKAKLHFIESKILTGAQLKAGDVDYDNEITIIDIAQMKLVMIGSKEI